MNKPIHRILKRPERSNQNISLQSHEKALELFSNDVFNPNTFINRIIYLKTCTTSQQLYDHIIDIISSLSINHKLFHLDHISVKKIISIIESPFDITIPWNDSCSIVYSILFFTLSKRSSDILPSSLSLWTLQRIYHLHKRPKYQQLFILRTLSCLLKDFSFPSNFEHSLHSLHSFIFSIQNDQIVSLLPYLVLIFSRVIQSIPITDDQQINQTFDIILGWFLTNDCADIEQLLLSILPHVSQSIIPLVLDKLYQDSKKFSFLHAFHHIMLNRNEKIDEEILIKYFSMASLFVDSNTIDLVHSLPKLDIQHHLFPFILKALSNELFSSNLAELVLICKDSYESIIENTFQVLSNENKKQWIYFVLHLSKNNQLLDCIVNRIPESSNQIILVLLEKIIKRISYNTLPSLINYIKDSLIIHKTLSLKVLLSISQIHMEEILINHDVKSIILSNYSLLTGNTCNKYLISFLNAANQMENVQISEFLCILYEKLITCDNYSIFSCLVQYLKRNSLKNVFVPFLLNCLCNDMDKELNDMKDALILLQSIPNGLLNRCIRECDTLSMKYIGEYNGPGFNSLPEMISWLESLINSDYQSWLEHFFVIVMILKLCDDNTKRIWSYHILYSSSWNRLSQFITIQISSLGSINKNQSTQIVNNICIALGICYSLCQYNDESIRMDVIIEYISTFIHKKNSGKVIIQYHEGLLEKSLGSFIRAYIKKDYQFINEWIASINIDTPKIDIENTCLIEYIKYCRNNYKGIDINMIPILVNNNDDHKINSQYNDNINVLYNDIKNRNIDNVQNVMIQFVSLINRILESSLHDGWLSFMMYLDVLKLFSASSINDIKSITNLPEWFLGQMSWFIFSKYKIGNTLLNECINIWINIIINTYPQLALQWGKLFSVPLPSGTSDEWDIFTDLLKHISVLPDELLLQDFTKLLVHFKRTKSFDLNHLDSMIKRFESDKKYFSNVSSDFWFDGHGEEISKLVNDIYSCNNYQYNILVSIHHKMTSYLSNIKTLSLSTLIGPSHHLISKSTSLSFPIDPSFNNHNDITMTPLGYIQDTIQVIHTKTRPKKLTFTSNSNISKCFLLKGMEDLRLDQKVIHLIRLSNLLLEHDIPKNSIKTYSIIPLSTDYGLIEWIQDGISLFRLYRNWVNSLTIKKSDERQRLMKPTEVFKWKLGQVCHESNINIKPLDIEHRNQLPDDILKKVYHGLARDTPCFLLSKFNNYDTKERFGYSMATMCVLGYLLGIGDRHPDNILHDSNGTIIHIDLNVSFDRGLHLPLPELVPFRLTRNYSYALGCSMLGKSNGNAVAMQNAGIRLLRERMIAILKTIKDRCIPYYDAYFKTFEWEVPIVDFVKKSDNIHDAIDNLDLSIDGDDLSQERWLLEENEAINNNKNGFKQVLNRIHSNEPVSEIVDKVLDQATSVSLLSRMYEGWMPWL